MKLRPGLNKWGSAALGVVCLLLVANLVAKYRDMHAIHFQAKRTAPSGLRPGTEKASPPDANSDLAQYDPTVHFGTLKKFDARPLPDEDRNPYEFVGGAPAPIPNNPGQPVTLPVVQPPPPPPPLPLKAVGYNELPGGKKEAMVTLNDDLMMVHEGEVIGTKYKVVKIEPTMIVIEDGDTHKTVELPFQP